MGSIRIVAGALRGRRIPVPAGARVRPTAERVREALFSILGEGIVGARVLDAYAGSGALGFEALSRGAREAWFVEVEPDLAAALARAAERFGVAARARIVTGHAVERLSRGAPAGAFEVIFVDPPYESAEAGRFLALAARRNLLGSGGTLVLERPSSGGAPETPPGLELVRSARYGDTRLELYGPARRADPEEGEAGRA